MVKMEESSKFNPLKPVETGQPPRFQKLAFPPAASMDGTTIDWKAKLRIGGFGSFFVLVLLPTLFASVYYFLIASDQYVSEAKFIVRSSDKQQVGGLGALLQTTGLGAAPEETFSVLDYMQSRDALKDVDRDLDYRAMMGADHIDFLSRFPNILLGETFEGMYDHYLKYITAIHDASTGISELTVKGFTPENSQKIATTLLDRAEDLINRMNIRAREDTLSLAHSEVAVAEKRVSASMQAIGAFQRTTGVVDPELTATAATELIAGLRQERAKILTEQRLVQRVSPESVRIPFLQEQLDSIDKQLVAEQQRLVKGDGSLAGTFGDFEQLKLEAEFASKALLTAEANLATARVEAARQQLYLERIVEPNTADYARYPKRFLAVLTVLMTCFLGYAIIWLLYVNAREHKH